MARQPHQIAVEGLSRYEAINAATVLILLVCSVALGAPIAGGTLVAMVMAVARLW